MTFLPVQKRKNVNYTEKTVTLELGCHKFPTTTQFLKRQQISLSYLFLLCLLFYRRQLFTIKISSTWRIERFTSVPEPIRTVDTFCFTKKKKSSSTGIFRTLLVNLLSLVYIEIPYQKSGTATTVKPTLLRNNVLQKVT